MKKYLLILFAIVLAGSAFAGCAADAYSKSCASCSFDAGKMDPACAGGYKASGITCTSASYPIMSAKYAKGECAAVDSCASELSSCIAQYSSGNDQADCSEGSLAICYSAADQCTKSAAVKCGEIETQCPGTSAGLVLLFFGVFAAKLKMG